MTPRPTGSLETHVVACPLCGAFSPAPALTIEDALYRTRDGFLTASIAHNVCSNDAFCFMSPRPTPAALSRYYTRSIEPVFDRNAASQRVRADLVMTFLGTQLPAKGARRVLDIGCNDGALLAHFVERGFEAVGIEPSQASANHCRATHPAIEVHAEPFEGAVARIRNRDFEVVTLVHVLEHLTNLHQILVTLRSLDLKWLFIEVPNALGGLYPRIMKEFGHLSFFSELTLTLALAQAGFRAVRARSREDGKDLSSIQIIAEPVSCSKVSAARPPLDAIQEGARLRNELTGIQSRWAREREALRKSIELLARNDLSERVALFGAGTDAFFILQTPGIAARTTCIIDSNSLTHGMTFLGRYPVLSLDDAIQSGIREILVTPHGSAPALCAALRAQVPSSVRVISCYEP